MTKRTEPRYHVALSYAGEDREYVAKVAAALAEQGVRYFYDQEEQVELWGTHLTEKLEEIYLDESASVLIFISEWYAAKTWPTQERRMAIIRAMEDPESVLSARFDDTQVRGILPDIVTMSAKDTPPEVLAQRVVEKLRLRGVLDSGTGTPVSKIALPEELTYVLSMVKPSISQFTYQHDRFQGPSLESMHVRQSVSEHGIRKPVEELFDDDRMFEESRLLSGLAQPFDDVLGLYDHLVIEGAAGHGKTTLGRHVALELTKSLLEPESAPGSAPTAIPLMLPARVLANYITTMSWEDALLTAAIEEYGNQAVGRMTADLFTRKCAGLPWLIIVDALDEIPDEDLCDRLLGVLAGRMALPDNPARFLITSRPLVRGQIAHLAGPLTGFYQLEPFDEEGLRRLAFKWFARQGVQTAEDFLSQVGEAGLGEVLRVPLLASIAADVFEARADRRLPASRYELYEQCIAQLAKRREGQREEVLAALTGTENGPALAEWLEKSGDFLLEQLASAYTTGQTSLREVLRAALPMSASPEAEGKVVEWLSHTGLLNPAAGRLRFQHQTFAEHLHANARARSLPAFQPDVPEWEDLIRGVLLFKPDDERVLLHYLHRHNRDESAVLTWLQQGTRSQREAAGRLIVAGAPFLDSHLHEFLEDVARLVTLDEMPRDQLTAMAALTRYPAVCAQLARLLNDDIEVSDKIAIADVLRNSPDARREGPRRLEELTARSHAPHVRCSAAEVLAKFGGTHRERAGAVLVDLAGDPTADVDARVNAAVVLLKLGDAHSAAVIDAFRAVIAAPAEDATTRIYAAVELAKVGHEHRAEAADALHGMACRVVERGEDRLGAVKELAKLGAEHRRAAVEVLRGWAEDPEAARHERAFALAELAGIERAYRHQAADRLIALALDATADGQYRIRASAELLRLGSEYRPRAADGHLAVLDGSTTDFFTRWSAADGLVELGGDHFVALGAQAWRKLAEDPSARDWSRYRIQMKLAALGGEYQAEAVRGLAAFAADPSERGIYRREAATALADLGASCVTQAIEIFVRQLDDPGSSAQERLLACMVLADLQPGAVDIVAASLFQIASTATASADVRRGVADAMAELGRLRLSRRSLLRELSQDYSVQVSFRFDAMCELVRLDSEDRDFAVPLLIGLIADPAVSDFDRTEAARVLGTESRAQRETAVQALVGFGSDATAPHRGRLRAASALAELGEDLQEEVARLYRAVAGDESSDLPDRKDAVRMLAGLSPAYRAEAVDLLRGMASVMAPHQADRCTLAHCLAGLGQEYLTEAAEMLVSVARCPEAAVDHRRTAAAGLADLGVAYRDEAAELLGQLAAKLDPTELEHARVKQALAAIDPRQRPAAVEALYRVATSRNTDVVDRRSALSDLIGFRGDFDGRLESMLLKLVADPVWDGTDRVRMGERLAALGERQQVPVIFRNVAQDPAVASWARLEAAEWLKRLGDGDAAVSLMRALAADSAVRMGDRRRAVQALAQHTGSVTPAISTLVEIAESEDVSTFSRRVAAQELIDLGPQGLTVATSLLGELARDAACDDWNRFWAAAELASLGGAARSTAAEALLELGEADTEPLPAAFALAELARIDERHHWRAVDALANVNGSAVERLQAATALLQLSRHHLERAAGLMRDLAEDRAQRCWGRRLAAQALASLGPAHLATATTALAEIVDDLEADPWERAEACHALAGLDAHRRDHVVEVLRELGGASTPGEQRLWVLTLFADLGPAGRAEAVAALRRIATDPGAEPIERALACCELARLDMSARAAACELLLQIGENDDAPVGDRRVVAVELASFGRKLEAQAIAVLRRLVNSGTAVDQALCRHELVVLKAADWSAARTALRKAQEFLAPNDQWLLARARAQSADDGEWSDLERLHRAVTSGADPANRLRAAVDLAQVVRVHHVVRVSDLDPATFARPRSRRFTGGLF